MKLSDANVDTKKNAMFSHDRTADTAYENAQELRIHSGHPIPTSSFLSRIGRQHARIHGKRVAGESRVRQR
jgi:hypothetical protein